MFYVWTMGAVLLAGRSCLPRFLFGRTMGAALSVLLANLVTRRFVDAAGLHCFVFVGASRTATGAFEGLSRDILRPPRKLL